MATVTAEFIRWPDVDGLVGRRWMSWDGPCEVLGERSPGGLYMVKRSTGMVQGMRSSIILSALAESEIHS